MYLYYLIPASRRIRSANGSVGCADSVRVARITEEGRLIASLSDCGLRVDLAPTALSSVLYIVFASATESALDIASAIFSFCRSF